MFSRLKIWQSLSLLGTLLVVPFIVLLVGFVTGPVQEDLVRDRGESAGTEYLSTARQMLQALQEHDHSYFMSLSGALPEKGDDDPATAIEVALAGMEAVDQRYGGMLQTTEDLRNVRASWETLKTELPSVFDAEVSRQRHRELLDQLVGLIRKAGDTSQLILDPKLETYYLMDAILVRIPDASTSLSDIRIDGTIAGASGTATPQERASLGLLVGTVLDAVEQIDRGLKVSFANDPSGALEAEISPLLRKTVNDLTAFLDLTRRELVVAESTDTDAAAYNAAAAAAEITLFALYDVCEVQLSSLLDERIASIELQRNFYVGMSITLLALVIFLGARFVLSLNRQIFFINDLFRKIDSGDYESRAEVTRGDELGATAANINHVLDNTLVLVQSQDERNRIQASIRNLLEDISGLGEGDLSKQAKVTEDITGAIADSINFVIGELRRIIGEVQDTTLQVSSAASEVQATAEHLAGGSETQSDQIVSTSSAIEEMATSIQQVSENAATALTVAQEALVSSRHGNEAVGKTIRRMGGIRQQVQETSKRMKRLGESSQEIGEIVQLIGDIADRTSILALNASIQAAMAGEAGRGFAVVADEVERLAERSAEATKRIEGLIRTIQNETTEVMTAMEETTNEVVQGSDQANEAGQSLGRIESVSNRLADLMAAISAAAKQQARGSDSVAKSMGEISEVTQQTAAGTKQAAVSIRNLAELADRLRASVSSFKL